MHKATTGRAGSARFALVAALYREQLGDAIRERRRELGLTQKELAKRVNIEEAQTISRWERGENAPTDLEAVARGLETNVSDLLSQLQTVPQRDRRRLEPDGATQLDRIEFAVASVQRQLNELLERLPASTEERARVAADRVLEEKLVEWIKARAASDPGEELERELGEAVEQDERRGGDTEEDALDPPGEAPAP